MANTKAQNRKWAKWVFGGVYATSHISTLPSRSLYGPLNFMHYNFQPNIANPHISLSLQSSMATFSGPHLLRDVLLQHALSLCTIGNKIKKIKLQRWYLWLDYRFPLFCQPRVFTNACNFAWIRCKLYVYRCHGKCTAFSPHISPKTRLKI